MDVNSSGLLDILSRECVVLALASRNVCPIDLTAISHLFFYLTVFKRVAEMALDIMRGIQGIGAAAMIPASVSLFLSCRSAHSEMRYDSSAWHSVEGIPSWTLAFHRLCNLFRGRSNRISLLHCSRQRSHTVN